MLKYLHSLLVPIETNDHAQNLCSHLNQLKKMNMFKIAGISGLLQFLVSWFPCYCFL